MEEGNTTTVALIIEKNTKFILSDESFHEISFAPPTEKNYGIKLMHS